jgi:hypothetical protein
MDEDIQVRAKKKIDELKSSKFKQQELPAWRPTPSFNSTLITFLLFGLIFLIIGIVLIGSDSNSFLSSFQPDCRNFSKV